MASTSAFPLSHFICRWKWFISAWGSLFYCLSSASITRIIIIQVQYALCMIITPVLIVEHRALAVTGNKRMEKNKTEN